MGAGSHGSHTSTRRGSNAQDGIEHQDEETAPLLALSSPNGSLRGALPVDNNLKQPVSGHALKAQQLPGTGAAGEHGDEEYGGGTISTARWYHALGRILSMAAPIAVSNVFGYSLSIVAAVAVGQLNDPVALSAVVMAGSLYNVTGLSLVIGLSSGMDTIAGQAYGAGNLLMVGETLQRATLICWAVSVPVVLGWHYAAEFMAFMHQSPDIIIHASRYLRLVAPSLFMSAIANNVSKYLTSQRVVLPGTVCTIITGALSPLYNWLFIYKWKMGVDGSALAFNAAAATNALLLVLATTWRDVGLRGKPERTWPGFTWHAFHNWGTYLKYGIPAAAMVCAEWWVFELVILMAGMLPPSQADMAVAVMGICFHTTVVCFMLPSAVGTACTTCIANELGAGHARDAALYFKLCAGMVFGLQMMLSSGLVGLRHVLPYAFTHTPEVVALAQRTLPLVAACVVGDGLNAVLGGVLRGCGRQAWGAALNLIGYWCLGFPLALILGFRLHWATLGFWTALATASLSQACIQLGFILRINWRQEVERAARLVHEDSHPGNTTNSNNQDDNVNSKHSRKGDHRGGHVDASHHRDHLLATATQEDGSSHHQRGPFTYMSPASDPDANQNNQQHQQNNNLHARATSRHNGVMASGTSDHPVTLNKHHHLDHHQAATPFGSALSSAAMEAGTYLDLEEDVGLGGGGSGQQQRGTGGRTGQVVAPGGDAAGGGGGQQWAGRAGRRQPLAGRPSATTPLILVSSLSVEHPPLAPGGAAQQQQHPGVVLRGSHSGVGGGALPAGGPAAMVARKGSGALTRDGGAAGSRELLLLSASSSSSQLGTGDGARAAAVGGGGGG